MTKVDTRKIVLVILFISILLVVALIVGKITYSYLAPTEDEDVVMNGEVTATGDMISFTSGNTLSLSATTDNFTTGGSNLTSSTNPKAKLVASSKTNEAISSYYVGVYIKSNSYVYSTSNSTPEIILTIKDEKGNNVTSVSGLTYVTQGGVSGFDVTDKVGLFDIKTDYPISTTSSTTGTTHTWTFTLTFVNLSTDQSVNENGEMDINVYLQQDTKTVSVDDVSSPNQPFSSFIKSMRSIDSSIYYHSSSLANGAGDNSYRYAGENPNNYVCFGSDAEICPTDNLYRIIGVFGDQVKLIKADYASSTHLGEDGEYAGTASSLSMNTTKYKGTLATDAIGGFNYDSNKKNTWKTSNLNKINLNTNFLTYLGTSWANKIANVSWTVGGNKGDKIQKAVASEVYLREVKYPVVNTIETAKVGLMYISDYGFAASPSAWKTNLYVYDSSSIVSVNWMYLGIDEWTITPWADGDYYIFEIQTGYPNGHGVNYESAVRPVFYLNSSVTRTSGVGTADNPYRLS